jgi:hypothetical protein
MKASLPITVGASDVDVEEVVSRRSRAGAEGALGPLSGFPPNNPTGASWV